MISFKGMFLVYGVVGHISMGIELVAELVALSSSIKAISFVDLNIGDGYQELIAIGFMGGRQKIARAN